MSDWYRIWPMTDVPARLAKGWQDAFLKSHGFPCGHYDFEFFPDSIVIEELGKDVPYGFVSRINVDYLRVDLLEVLSPEITLRAEFGEILHVRQGPLADIKTIWSRTRVPIRGGKKSECWRCSECGQLIYYPRGRWYALAGDLVGAPVHLADGGIIVDQKIFERLKGRPWKKVDIRKLTVLDKPRDGFPAELSTITREQERKWTPPT